MEVSLPVVLPNGRYVTDADVRYAANMFRNPYIDGTLTKRRPSSRFNDRPARAIIIVRTSRCVCEICHYPRVVGLFLIVRFNHFKRDFVLSLVPPREDRNGEDDTMFD